VYYACFGNTNTSCAVHFLVWKVFQVIVTVDKQLASKLNCRPRLVGGMIPGRAIYLGSLSPSTLEVTVSITLRSTRCEFQILFLLRVKRWLAEGRRLLIRLVTSCRGGFTDSLHLYTRVLSFHLRTDQVYNKFYSSFFL